MTNKLDIRKLFAAPIMEDVYTCNGCCEPGYDDKPVIMANWNNIPSKIFDILEDNDYACEWSDEWIICDGCNKAFRTSPDSYSWSMYGDMFDGYALCGDCIEYDEYYENKENNPRIAITNSILRSHPLTDYGYTQIESDYKNGLHQGMNDDPVKILAKLLENNPAGRYIFVIDENSQFYITFSVYIKQ